MKVQSMLYQLIIGPLALVFDMIYAIALRITTNPGLAIVFLSLTMNLLVLPLYRKADAMQEEEKRTLQSLTPGMNHIKKAFKGDERYMMLQTYYRQNMRDIITSPKTEQSNRTIDIPEFLGEELSEYMSRIYGLQDNDRIFPVVPEAVQHALKRRIDKYGLKKIRVHDFRHSHCAYLIDQGVDPLIIKERLGHADIKITLNTYGHLYPSRQKEVAEMLNKTKRGDVSESDQ